MVPPTEHELRHALSAGRLVPFAQPMKDIVSGRIIGFDCAWRCVRAGGADSGAAELKQGAWTRELCWQLLERLLGAAGAAARAWPHSLVLSIDLPGPLLADWSLPMRIAAFAAGAGLPASQLLLGIAERVAAAQHQAVGIACMQLRSLELRTMLADFDGRHCTPAQLADLALDRVRIDRRIIGAMELRFQDYRMVASALGLARGLDLTTVAGGVDSQGQADMLALLGCDVGQGDRFGAAIPLDQIRPDEPVISPAR